MSSGVWQPPYDRHAAGYANQLDGTLVGPVERVVEMAGACPGVQLLDIGTGTGTIARAAAARGASVVGIDASAGMLEVARTLSPELDLRLADACSLPFGDGVFDVVACGLSISHFTDREKALREVLRVLRHGGSFVASAWADGGSGPTRTIFEILDRYAARDDSLDEKTWATGRLGSDVLREVGFTSVSVETQSFSGAFADAEEALAWVVAWPLAAARLARLDARRRERFFSRAREALVTTSLSWSFAFNFYVAHRPAT
jgi:SAM-dependent methyltransferase